MGNVLELPLQGCPRPALQDCSSSERTTDTVTVDVSRLSVDGKGDTSQKVLMEPCARSPTLRGMSVVTAHGDSESTTISVSPQAEALSVRDAPDVPDALDVPDVPDTHVPDERSGDERSGDEEESAEIAEQTDEPEAMLSQPDKMNEDPAACDVDVLHVIAAMSASHGEVQEVQAAAPLAAPLLVDKPLIEVESPEARARCSSRSTEDEPECECCEAVSSRAPSPDAVPSPDILLPGRPTLLGMSGPRFPRLRPAFDEGRLRRASQLFASMLRGEPLPKSKPRRRSAPPRQESRFFGARTFPRLLPEGARRASSVDSREVVSRPLRPLNGQMPWFPSALPMRDLRSARTRLPALPWARKVKDKEGDELTELKG